MCQIFASIPREKYDYQSRSIRIQGHVTSIRLEAMYWQILEESAQAQEMTLAQFLSQLYDEVLKLDGEVYNFTSLLRCGCINYLNYIKGNEDTTEKLKQEAKANSINLTRPANSENNTIRQHSQLTN